VGHFCPPGSGSGSSDLIESGSEILGKAFIFFLSMYRIRKSHFEENLRAFATGPIRSTVVDFSHILYFLGQSV
jgi:hypothetical protein